MWWKHFRNNSGDLLCQSHVRTGVRSQFVQVRRRQIFTQLVGWVDPHRPSTAAVQTPRNGPPVPRRKGTLWVMSCKVLHTAAECRDYHYWPPLNKLKSDDVVHLSPTRLEYGVMSPDSQGITKITMISLHFPYSAAYQLIEVRFRQMGRIWFPFRKIGPYRFRD